MEAQVGFFAPQSKHTLLHWADLSLLNICMMSDFDGPDIIVEYIGQYLQYYDY